MFNLILIPDYLTRPPVLQLRPREGHAILPLFVHAHEPPLTVCNVNVRVVVVVYPFVNRMRVGQTQVEGCLL